MASLSWGTRTQIATGQVGSYTYPSSNYYTFYLYATATLSNRTASIKIEYIVTPNGQTYSQYSGPYWELYINGSKVSTNHQSAITASTTLTTYTYTIDADASGNFAEQTIQGKWIRDGSSGYPPKDLTISGSATLPYIGAITPSTSLKYWDGSEWRDILSLGSDYVIEQGTSGDWIYRKWNSGIAECWASVSKSITAWNAWERLYEGTPAFYLNYPSGLFVAIPVLTCNAYGASVGVSGVELYSSHSTTRTPTIYPLRPGSAGSSTVDFYLHAIGRWKT